MQHIERTKKLMNEGWSVIANPDFLESEFQGKSTDEIKAARNNKAEQLSPAAQHELSLRGDRVAFVEFHRFIYGLDDADIQLLKNAMKNYVTDEKLSEDDSLYCDQQLLNDVIDYHLCIRFEKWFDAATADQIARSYRQNQKLALNFQEITSGHLIKFVNSLLEKYAKKH